MNHRIHFRTELVKSLLTEQFPQWKHLVISAIKIGPRSNCVYRLGEDKIIRLPINQRSSRQSVIEQQWLHIIEGKVPVRVPKIVGFGKPSDIYPYRWSVYDFISGTPISEGMGMMNSKEVISDLAEFLSALHKVETENAPRPGAYNKFRGGELSHYDAFIRTSIEQMDSRNQIDKEAALRVWDEALNASQNVQQKWIHGDLTTRNILVQDGRISGIIDFSNMTVGDIAYDLMPSLKYCDELHREIFQEKMSLDTDTWLRAKGWTLWMLIWSKIKDQSWNPSREKMLANLLKG